MVAQCVYDFCTNTPLFACYAVMKPLRQNNAPYRLTSELRIDSNQVLSLTEAAEVLGFAVVEQGDINVTSLGVTFAEASILARKELFAQSIQRLPLVRWLTTMLTHSEPHALAWEVILTALELEFSQEEAEKELETLIDWGRYAELLAYDDAKALIYLETTPQTY